MTAVGNGMPTGNGRMPGFANDEVPVRSRWWCSAIMVPLAAFMCLAQVSFAAQPYMHPPQGGRFVWMILATLLGFVFPFLLLLRDRHPEPVFWICCAVTIVFPYDPLMAMMALSSLLARRSSHARTMRAIVAGAGVAVYAQLRDALQTADASIWHMIFAKPNTGRDGVPIAMLADETTILVTAGVFAVIEVTIATLVGLHIRSRANLETAKAQADAATTHAATLQSDLDDQHLADAIAAEAHDTLAHSLSLLALNASALQAETAKLGESPASSRIAGKAEDIRRQAAGALDEAHAIIDMLRHPATAWQQLAPGDETALTRESLGDLIGQARTAGMRLDTWIDIHQLSELDDATAKVAYRAIQEGLTNARRHAPGAPVSLEVDVSPTSGIHVHLSNPATSENSASTVSNPVADAVSDAMSDGAHTPSADPTPSRPAHVGAGLAGLTARAQSVGGTCRHGLDERGAFHLDVHLPWRASANQHRHIADR